MFWFIAVQPNPAAAKDTAHALVNVTFPAGSLPPMILAVLLAGFFAVVIYAMSKAKEVQGFLGTFPGQKATVVFGLAGFTYIVTIAGARLALGLAFPDNYHGVMWIIAGCLGFGAGAGVGKHAFSVEREQAKGEAAAKIAAATAPQPTQVLAASGSSVSVSTEAQPTGEHAVPRAGVKPRDPDVVRGIEAIADSQHPVPYKPASTVPPDPDEG